MLHRAPLNRLSSDDVIVQTNEVISHDSIHVVKQCALYRIKPDVCPATTHLVASSSLLLENDPDM